MTPVKFTFTAPDGEPIVDAEVEITLARSDVIDEETGILMPRQIFASTDEDGEVIVPLAITDTHYTVRVEDPLSSARLRYRFLVPELAPPATSLRLQDLVIEGQLPVIDPASQPALDIIVARAQTMAAATETEAWATTVAGQAMTVASQAAVVATTLGTVQTSQTATEAAAAAAALSKTAAEAAAGVSVALAPSYGPTPPLSPVASAEWIDSNTGRTFTWIVEGGQGQWVETGAVASIGYAFSTEMVELLGGLSGAALMGFSQAGIGAVLRTAQAKLRDQVNLKDFGAIGDGTTDDTAAIQAAFHHVMVNGGTLRDAAGATFLTGAITLNTSAKAWAFQGIRGATKFVRKDDTVGTLFSCTGSSYPFVLDGFTVDCKHSVYPNGNHGISILNANWIRLSRIDVVDWKNSAILVYAAVANTFGDCLIEDCTAVSAANAANNGMLIVDMYRSGFRNCYAKGAIGLPGYGVQLKNDCRHGFVTNCFGEACKAALAFGQDSITGVRYGSVSGMMALSCTTGFIAGYASFNRIDGLFVDMASAGENAIDLNVSCVGNSIQASVLNLAAVKGAARIRTGSTDNVINLDYLDNVNSTGKAAIFDSGSERNTVTLERAANPTQPATGPNGWVTDNSIAYNNAFRYGDTPNYLSATIAAGVITVKNPWVDSIVVDTEASSASDDLDTITGHAFEGKLLTLRTNIGTRDIVVRHNVGNILVAGAANFTLGTSAASLTLRYNTRDAKWCEISRATV